MVTVVVSSNLTMVTLLCRGKRRITTLPLACLQACRRNALWQQYWQLRRGSELKMFFALRQRFSRDLKMKVYDINDKNV